VNRGILTYRYRKLSNDKFDRFIVRVSRQLDYRLKWGASTFGRNIIYDFKWQTKFNITLVPFLFNCSFACSIFLSIGSSIALDPL
jgi:hypothetical protein